VTPHARLLRLAAWASAASLALVGVAAALPVHAPAEAARRFLALCGLGG